MDACITCMGTGLDQSAPTRTTQEDAPLKAVLTLLKPCGDCEGHGVIQRGRDRDLLKRPPFHTAYSHGMDRDGNLVRY